MKWLVTGGAGFIGSNFVFYMLDKYPQDQIVCLDKLTYAGNLETLESVMENPRFTFVKGDIADLFADQYSGNRRVDGRLPQIRDSALSSGIYR